MQRQGIPKKSQRRYKKRFEKIPKKIAKGVTTGRAGGIKLGNSGVKILSPDKNSWAKAGGTLIKFGNAFRIDTGAMWGLHMHILSSGHLPLGAVIAGLIGAEY